jgi:glycine/D-amino acid oxidase-like deaminating enzyme
VGHPAVSGGSPDVLVVGAGIVGACCAWAFSREGLKVTVVDRGGIGQGATAAGMGHIVVMDDSEPQFDLCRYSQVVWNELRPSAPADVEWVSCGTLWVANDEDEMAEATRKHSYFASRGVDTETLDEKALAEAEPNLRRGLPGGLLQIEDSAIYAPCAGRWLLGLSNAQVKLGAEVTEVRTGSVRLADGSEIAAGTIVLATGDAAPRFAPFLPIRPRKGHLAITDRYPGWLRYEVIELGYVKSASGESTESVACNVQPRATGQLLIGSSRQYGAATPEIDHAVLGKMLRRCIEYMPGLGALSVIRTWTGFRASTPDKLPVIGPHPDLRGIWLATGHEGLGITMAAGTARVLADAVLGRAPAIPLEPFLPQRFSAVPHHA